ncbi:LOG family protein [Mangrovibacterium lignilyticum]|uniref:LOG family protein n=1 Tax=Mangrovibacterium lignilyticum TaxID=2668052 RepID=UPI0013D30266|nr:TIGR00730 family Rossman fold protein [Mangrovibacterium lignilyticum]
MKICVFASSSNALAQVYVDEAIKLARLIGEQGQTLVNGAANVGLMHEMLDKANEKGAHTIGIIPEKLQGHKLVSEHAKELYITKDMMERKALMRELSDAFVALPGGFGTLEEILEVITLKQLDYHNKAVVFLNTNGFYDDLFRQFERSFDENFAKPAYRDLYFVAANGDDAMEYLKNYAPPTPVNKWYKVPTNGLPE